MDNSLLIVPTYNERENVPVLVKAIRKVCPEIHLLFVDDSSPDGTAEVIKNLQKEDAHSLFLEVRPQKDGLGNAYKHGFSWALARDYQYIFEMDADLSHPPSAIPKMLECLKKECDVVIGSRYLQGVQVINWPLSRIVLSIGASYYVRLLTGLPVNDPTAGFVGYTRKALASLDLSHLHFVGYAFQIEMKFKLWKKGFRLIEIPIIFTNREKGTSKMNGSIIWEAIYGVIYLKFKSIFNNL